MPPRLPMAGASTAPRHRSAANDNAPAPATPNLARRALLREALRHYATHGAGAAELARSHAEHAFFSGRRRDYLHWTAICRTLDRRMVEAAGAAPPRLR